MKYLQKAAAFVLILAMVACLLLPGGLALRADAAENAAYSFSGVYVNPLYADVVTESSLMQVPPTLGAEPDAQAEDPKYVTTVEEAALTLRQAMKQRVDTVTVYFQTPELSDDYTEADFKGQVQAIVVEAMEHTGVPTEGDYLKWQHAGWRYNASGKFAEDNGETVIQWPLVFTLTYYTTADQEKEVDAAVEKLLESMDIAEAPDYLKIKTIYDYITEHVVYDHDNLYDDAYKLKYTAYAALQNGTAVCQGYALLLYRLALELDVDCRLIAGMGGNEAHGWNIIELKDLYYDMDATWDAQATKYNYFLRCEKNFPNHTRDAEYDTKSFHAAYPMAEADYVPTANDTCKRHTYDNGQVTTQPTCDKEGVKTFTCTNCGYTYTKPVPTVDHTYTSEVQEPTCDKEGLTTYTCSVCGDSYTEAIPTLDHVYETTVTDPTCTEQGYTTYTCTGCGKYYIGEHTDPLGHECASEAPVFNSETRTHSALCTRCEENIEEKCTFDDGVVIAEATILRNGVREYTCSVCAGTYTEEIPYVARVYGNTRYETAYAVANELKTVLGVEKFDTIIVACGSNFPDALSGSYLAAIKDAPILLAKTNNDTLLAYIQENLSDDGLVYILGSDVVVSKAFEDSLKAENIKVERLAGATRYLTNLAILEEAGITGNEMLISTSMNYADSLSASSTGLPILLINNSKKDLTTEQKEFLAQRDSWKFYILGSKHAVCEEFEAVLSSYGEVIRIYGNVREETSLAIARDLCPAPESMVLAYSQDFPDGLCGGVLAYNMNAPLILTRSSTKMEELMAQYVDAYSVNRGVILGSSKLISDSSAKAMFQMADDAIIMEKN